MSKDPKQAVVPLQDEPDRKSQVVLDTGPDYSQIKIVQSGLSELTSAKKAIDALRLNSSSFDMLNEAAKTINRLKLNPSVLNSISNAGKAFEGLRVNSSIAAKLGEAAKTLHAPLANATKASSSAQVRSDTQPSYYLPANATRGKAIRTPADFGVVLREARKAMGLTQQQFADAAGVGRRFVSECESGKPRLEFGKVIQVANAAGIDLLAQRR